MQLLRDSRARLKFVTARLVVSLGIIAFGAYAGPAMAEASYPSKPVTFIVPWGPGGGSDMTAREIARLATNQLKVPIPVINIPGATGTVGMAKLVGAPADGYTIGLMAADTYALLASDPPEQWNEKEFVPIAVMIKQTSAIIVPDNSPFKTWNQLVEAAEAKPDSVTIAIGGIGSPQEMTINYLRSRGIGVLAVPYAKPGERYAAVMGGQIHGFYEALGNAKNFLESKRMRPILLFCSTRLASFPDVPCSVEVGLDITLPQFRAVVVRTGTDPQKMQALARALEEVAGSEAYKSYLRGQFADEDSYIPRDRARTFMREQLDVMKQIIAASGGKK